jgi:hypothetical protein
MFLNIVIILRYGRNVFTLKKRQPHHVRRYKVFMSLDNPLRFFDNPFIAMYTYIVAFFYYTFMWNVLKRQTQVHHEITCLSGYLQVIVA